jgi:hypothetical protein
MKSARYSGDSKAPEATGAESTTDAIFRRLGVNIDPRFAQAVGSKIA